MNRIITGILVGVISFASIAGTSAMENNSTLSDINKMSDPYEQCVAYVKLKQLTNVDCKARLDAMKQKQEPKKDEKKNEYVTRGTGMLSQSGSMGAKPPRPPMGSGAMMGSGTKQDHRECLIPGSCGQGLPQMGSGAMMRELEIKGLGLAIGKLNPEERMELMKMIRTYLESKGVSLLNNIEIKKEENNNWDTSVRGNSMSEKIKNQQEVMQAKIKALKEKQKEYTNNISLKK